MDQALQQLERRAKTGDIDALWQAYYMLKRSLPNLSIKNLRKLQSACGDEIYNNRTFDLQIGSKQRLAPSVTFDDNTTSLREIVVAHLKKYDYFQKDWHQSKELGWEPRNPICFWGYVYANPETKLKFYTRNRRYCRDFLKPQPELEISGDDPPKPRHAYLVWAVNHE